MRLEGTVEPVKRKLKKISEWRKPLIPLGEIEIGH
jgi:hypothetical protein